MTGYRDFWEAEDFIDTYSTDMLEDDPWSATEPDHSHHPIANSASAAITGHIVERQLPLPAPPAHSETFDVTGRNVYDTDCLPVHENLAGDDEGAGLFNTILEETMDELAEDNIYENDDEAYLEEPEPTTEFNAESHIPLYDMDDASVGDDVELTRTLRLDIDEFISSIHGLSEEEKTRILELLSKFSSRSLVNWLQWLPNKEWTSDSLILFLEFRDVWGSNPHWWEVHFWSAPYGGWLMNSSQSNLSRDACYELIKHRQHCSSHEVIDETWLTDWNNQALWEHGFQTFASFALFRASLSQGDDWATWLSIQSDSQSDVYYNEYLNPGESDSLYRVDRCSPSQWFAIQDWYDYADWHDNLGWGYGSIDACHPYLADERTDTYR